MAVTQFLRFRGKIPALCAVLLLASCEAAGTLAGGGAQSDYLVARQALETGNYDLAIRRYGALMDQVDASAASRLQLEYAHALLRGNRYDEAVALCDTLIARQTGSIRASALSVRGTARHEAARRLLDAGREPATARALLVAASADIDAFLAAPGALDAAGSMRARSQLISADLARLS